MRKLVIRIPHKEIPSTGLVIPKTATSPLAAVEALSHFLTSPPPRGLPARTAVLSGAGISVSSGLADYRGSKGTYRVHKTFRPIYYHEFVESHESRKRYWARSFLGWTSLHKANPNSGHYAIKHLGDLGLVNGVITQNVDSFHPRAHPDTPTLELHGYLRRVICTSCRQELARETFQKELARLNPTWAALLAEAVTSESLGTGVLPERSVKGIRSNPDGDVDVPDAPYSTFRYPACPRCLESPPLSADGRRATVAVDNDGAWSPTSSAGILKPAVVLFGENIATRVKDEAERMLDGASRLLVLGTSLATYSAMRIVKKAKEKGMPIGVVNLGGVRGETQIFEGVDPHQPGGDGVRVDMSTDILLPAVVSKLRSSLGAPTQQQKSLEGDNATVFKEMLS